MAVPGFQAFLRPVLDQYADGAERRARDLGGVIGSILDLSQPDLEERWGGSGRSDRFPGGIGGRPC